MNRLLFNMKNKITSLNGSIDLIYRLQRGEEIKFGEGIDGALKYSVTKKDGVDYNQVLCELFDERENLQLRVNRFKQV